VVPVVATKSFPFRGSINAFDPNPSKFLETLLEIMMDIKGSHPMGRLSRPVIPVDPEWDRELTEEACPACHTLNMLSNPAKPFDVEWKSEANQHPPEPPAIENHVIDIAWKECLDEKDIITPSHLDTSADSKKVAITAAVVEEHQSGGWKQYCKVILTGLSSSIIAGSFFTVSLILSAIWAVPGHSKATDAGGFMNRVIWAVSPCFLGSFFPGLCTPKRMTSYKAHLFFITVSLIPFIVADVAFPYVVGTDTKFKVYFSTCFWPTTTCLFFLPSMIAGIRWNNGDMDWWQLSTQRSYFMANWKQLSVQLLCLITCFVAAVFPVNYIALDFAAVLPNLHPNQSTVVRPLISVSIRGGCFELFKVASQTFKGSELRIYGLFPVSLNLGLNSAMAVVLCQDWLSVGVWIFCDFATISWRILRLKVREVKWLVPYVPFLNFSDEEVKQKGLDNIILGWGLTGALTSLLMVSPFAWILPEMIQKFLFPQGVTSLLYLIVVSVCDILLDIGCVLAVSKICKCDFGKILGYHPFSKMLRHAYISSLTVVWAPCALGNFGWVFQHLCVAAFETAC